MSAAQPIVEVPQPERDLRLLVELPSRPGVFLGNLRDLVFPRRQPALELRSAPGAFWPDVFVERPLPWGRVLQSGGLHVAAFAVLIVAARIMALQPHVVQQPVFDHSQVVYYQPSEYLPPLDTRTEQTTTPRLAEPEFSQQAIISLPREADNRKQTIVAAPNVKLKQDVAMPNIVAWSDKVQKPQLAIPPVPLTPAAEISRIAPQVDAAVVTPPPDASRLNRRRSSPMLQNSVVAPPPDVNAADAAGFHAPEPAVVAPPPSVETASTRVGQLNIAPSSVIAPAPQLAVADQRAVPATRSFGGGMGGTQVVPPPPSAAGGADFGARGRVIALNLHPAVGAPPEPPAGNRRGAFGATPSGRAGASGAPGAAAGGTTGGMDSHGKGNGPDGGGRAGKTDAPSGLYVGNAGAKPSAVAGDPGATAAESAKVVAVARAPKADVPSRTASSGSASKLSEAERAVFGDRKFYSLTLNMPNLNSAGGSWVIRFAELDHDAERGTDSSPPMDMSQPMATRKVDPAYPLQLMRENVAGTVILYAIIHADGSVGGVRVLRGVDDRLDRYASEAVAQWRFQPATKNGAPVDVEATFQIPFRPVKRNF